jgi:hypothetical protein
MLYGKTADGQMIEAAPKLEAVCPNCNKELVAKCGDLVIWHWAHQDLSECDPYWEPESAWHRDWKKLVMQQFCEVPINGHRADIVADDGMVMELQHSAINLEEIAEREAAYGEMLWLFDVRESYIENRFHTWSKQRYDGFRWYRPRVSTVYCKQKVCFDLGTPGIFEVREMEYTRACMRGWGELWPKDLFVGKYLRHRLRKPENEGLKLLPQQITMF